MVGPVELLEQRERAAVARLGFVPLPEPVEQRRQVVHRCDRPDVALALNLAEHHERPADRRLGLGVVLGPERQERPEVRERAGDQRVLLTQRATS